MLPALNRSKRVCSLLFLFHAASLWTRCSSGSIALDLGSGDCLLFLDILDPGKGVGMRLTDDLLNPGVPPLDMVVGFWLVLVKIVPVDWGKIPIDPGGGEIIECSGSSSRIGQ